MLVILARVTSSSCNFITTSIFHRGILEKCVRDDERTRFKQGVCAKAELCRSPWYSCWRVWILDPYPYIVVNNFTGEF